jgi:hypothetical protein
MEVSGFLMISNVHNGYLDCRFVSGNFGLRGSGVVLSIDHSVDYPGPWHVGHGFDTTVGSGFDAIMECLPC